MEEETKVVLTKDSIVLINHRNTFRKTLIEATIDLKRNEYIKKINPNFQRKEQNGKFIGIDEMIENCKKGSENAKSYVDICDELLVMAGDGNLEEAWKNINVTETPAEVVAETPAEQPQEAEKPAVEEAVAVETTTPPTQEAPQEAETPQVV